MGKPAVATLWAAADATQPAARSRIGKAAATWLAIILGGIVTITALVLWHLIRRGRLIREGLEPPKMVHLPYLDADDEAVEQQEDAP